MKVPFFQEVYDRGFVEPEVGIDLEFLCQGRTDVTGIVQTSEAFYIRVSRFQIFDEGQ